MAYFLGIPFPLLILLTLAGCTAPAVYESAARQGVEFEHAMVRYTNTAKSVTVTSRARLMAEDILPLSDPDIREEKYRERLQNIQAGAQIYDTVREHAAVMRSYFVELQKLAASNAPKESEAAISETVKAMKSLGNKLTSSDFLSEPTGTIVGELVKQGVRIYQRKLLSIELRNTGEFIESQLILQKEAVALIGKILKRDLDAADRAMRNALALQLLDDPSAVDTLVWSNRVRDVVLVGQASLGDAGVASEAQRAVERMLQTWRNLIRRASGKGELKELWADVNALAKEVQNLETTTDTLASAFGF